MTAHQTIESQAPADTIDRAMTGAEIVVRGLVDQGVEVLFGYPGGAIMPFYDALVDSRLRHILVRHEQGAALAANGYARASGRHAFGGQRRQRLRRRGGPCEQDHHHPGAADPRL